MYLFVCLGWFCWQKISQVSQKVDIHLHLVKFGVSAIQDGATLFQPTQTTTVVLGQCKKKKIIYLYISSIKTM